jgi:hypothetical protein
MLGRFNEDLSALTRAMRSGDGDALFKHFERTRAIRKGIVEIGQDSPVPDFGRPHPHLTEDPSLPSPLRGGPLAEGEQRGGQPNSTAAATPAPSPSPQAGGQRASAARKPHSSQKKN